MKVSVGNKAKGGMACKVKQNVVCGMGLRTGATTRECS
jgi:hypothetical protein